MHCEVQVEVLNVFFISYQYHESCIKSRGTLLPYTYWKNKCNKYLNYILANLSVLMVQGFLLLILWFYLYL